MTDQGHPVPDQKADILAAITGNADHLGGSPHHSAYRRNHHDDHLLLSALDILPTP